MGIKKRIGLIYNYDEKWIGGTYYIENIIKALNILKDFEKPQLVIYTASFESYERLKLNTAYPYLSFQSTKAPSFTIVERILNKLGRLTVSKNLITKKPDFSKIDWVFPNPSASFFDELNDLKRIFWIPDFQEEHLPEFFSPEEIAYRKKGQGEISNKKSTVVFSSKNAEADFNKLYPVSNATRILLPFAVSIAKGSVDSCTSAEILKKYQIKKKFIIVPNQLWIHKNHRTVLKAVEILNNHPLDFEVIFTGKEDDYRFPDFPSELKELSKELNVDNVVRFLGFIPKEDLELLVEQSVAVLQPSLFEGWNTIIEEAKASNKYIIASDIEVHLEQLKDYPNREFFKKLDEQDLADKIIAILSSNIIHIPYDYKNDVTKFAKAFLKIGI